MGFVYVLTNPVMPGLVKIGRTSQDDANTRIAQLYTTGVPVPFTLEFAGRVTNEQEVEMALHTAFNPYRINPNREFFRIGAEQAIAILKLIHIEDTTIEVSQQPTEIDTVSAAAAEQQKSRRPNFNFAEMGIPVGSELKSTYNDNVVTTLDARRVQYGENAMYLSAVTRMILGTDYYVSPLQLWTYNGSPLNEIYEQTYAIN
ncbi:GIY-YIG nuclease family protein [Geothrix campi]|uniref:GIY-YIG nuclease family protein n=1 Tax=Geothrix campi TaxID=2966450 RepID=UPI0021486185|nr:GIY-YIG nuclease family protein [Geothrix sp. SG10]